MRVEFDQTEDDLVAAGVAQLRHDPMVRKQLAGRRAVAVVLGYGGAAFLALYFTGAAESSLVAMLVTGVGMILLAGMIWPTAGKAPAEAKRFARRMLSSPAGPWLLGPRSFEVTPDALLVKTRASETRLRWEAVGYVVRDDDYVCIGIPGPAAYAIPRVAFETDTKFEQFAEAAGRAHAAARREHGEPGAG